MFVVEKIGEDVWVAMEEKVEEKEIGLPYDLGMSQEEWDRLEEQLEADAISWWV